MLTAGKVTLPTHCPLICRGCKLQRRNLEKGSGRDGTLSIECFVQAIYGFFLGLRRGGSITSKTREKDNKKCVVFLLENLMESTCDR